MAYEHNYKLKLERMRAEGKMPTDPGLCHVNVRHDDWCGIFRGRLCNCDPDITLVDDATWLRREDVTRGKLDDLPS